MQQVVSINKPYVKRRFPLIKPHFRVCTHWSERCVGTLSMASGHPLVPTHWRPKDEADKAARRREELAIYNELDKHNLRYTITI